MVALAAGGPLLGPLGDLQQLPGLDVSVRQQVGFQVGPLVEAPLTNGTPMGRLLHVKDLVNCQGSGLAEALAAFVTFEGLLFGVNVSVVSKVVLPAEGLAANITIEGSLIGVGPLVDEEVVGFGELSVAVLADETFLGSRSSSGSPQQSGIVVGWVDCREASGGGVGSC